MNKIIPFEKDIAFKTNIEEITSISLERQLSINNQLISGEIIINGDYKITSSSTTVESFEYEIPIRINIDDNYDTSQALIDIDDFYYEVVNDNILKISVDLKIDKIKEKEIIDMDSELDRNTDEEDIKIVKEDNIENVKDEDISTKMNSLFTNISEVDNYVSYNIYIFREGDALNSIMDKYSVTEEDLSKYNDLNNLEIGTKIVIPNK